MGDSSNAIYVIEKSFNDLGSHVGNIGYAGKTEVTILDNLYRISQLLHGRILASSSILGGYKIYIPKAQLRELVLAYQVISPYRLSNDIDPLIQSLRNLLQSAGNDAEVGVDSRITMQMVTVHNSISTSLKSVWEGVVSFRLISYSGFNKDITIDGKQQTFDLMLSKFSDSEMHQIRGDLERCGQLAGIRSSRQVEMRDMVADLIFSRKDSYVTLHQLFYTMKQQRHDLRRFRTDILFCPVDRYKELDSGLNVKILMTIERDTTNCTLKPRGFEFAEFKIHNPSYEQVSFMVAGSIGPGKYVLQPLQTIQVFGTGISFELKLESVLKISGWSDIRSYTGSGPSIVSLALDGKLRDNALMSHFFFQIIKPMTPYLNSFVTKVQTSEVLRLCISKLAKWAVTIFDTLQAGHIYSGWLLVDKSTDTDRMLYIYMLTIMIPEFLLDPTFTFSDAAGTPPYMKEYNSYVQGLRKLYE